MLKCKFMKIFLFFTFSLVLVRNQVVSSVEGKKCTVDSDCNEVGRQKFPYSCKNGNCTCPSGTFEWLANTCIDEPIYSSCDSDLDCFQKVLECKNGKCVCENSTLIWNGLSCISALNIKGKKNEVTDVSSNYFFFFLLLLVVALVYLYCQRDKLMQCWKKTKGVPDDPMQVYYRNIPTDPGHPGYKDPNQPEPNYPSQPGPNYPSQPGPNYPSQPAPNYPSQPAPNYPSQPAPNYPSQPAPNYPSQPAPNYPSQPAPNYPSQPAPNYPSQPAPNYPSYPMHPGSNYPVHPGTVNPGQPTDRHKQDFSEKSDENTNYPKQPDFSGMYPALPDNVEQPSDESHVQITPRGHRRIIRKMDDY